MLTLIYILIFSATVAFIFGILPPQQLESRPKLMGLTEEETKAKKAPLTPRMLFKAIAMVNKPLCLGFIGQRAGKELSMARMNLTAEEFFLIKELLIALYVFVTRGMATPDLAVFWTCISVVIGYMLPEVWLKRKIKQVKNSLIKELPDVIDLMGLCVNAGLDFMLALKWVVEKSRQSVLVSELNLVMQEINVGKSRRNALSDLSKKYDLPDLSTFTRTLIQADRMGTSVADALNIISEDMRLSRFRRGEQIALKAPLKMLVPLLFFIFPVVGILVAAPILLDFLKGGSTKSISTGLGAGN